LNLHFCLNTIQRRISHWKWMLAVAWVEAVCARTLCREWGWGKFQCVQRNSIPFFTRSLCIYKYMKWLVVLPVLLKDWAFLPFSRVEFTFPTNGRCGWLELINLEGVMWWSFRNSVQSSLIIYFCPHADRQKKSAAILKINICYFLL